jgi:hypothetical protein
VWVSQSYLSNFGSNAAGCVYYLFEDYLPGQADFEREVFRSLDEIGFGYGDDVHIFVPNERYRQKIAIEFPSKFHDVWEQISGKTPGLFISTKPAIDLEPNRDPWLYLSLLPAFEGKAKLIDALREFRETLAKFETDFHGEVDNDRGRSLLKKICDSLVLRPTFFGVGIDVKTLIEGSFSTSKKGNARR